jgi:hypothetical protein
MSRLENQMPRIEAGSASAEAGGNKRTDYRPRNLWDHPALPAGPQGPPTACRCTRPSPAVPSSDACFCPSHASADAEHLMITNRPTLAFKGRGKKKRNTCGALRERRPPRAARLRHHLTYYRRPLLILALDHIPGITPPPTAHRRPSTHPSANALSSGFASVPGMRWGRGRGPQEVRLRSAKSSFCACHGWETPALAPKQGTRALKQAKAKGHDTARGVRGTPRPAREPYRPPVPAHRWAMHPSAPAAPRRTPASVPRPHPSTLHTW